MSPLWFNGDRARGHRLPSVVVWPPPPGRRLAGVPVGVLVCWQVALLLAMVGTGRPTAQLLALSLVAAALIAGTALRPRGRWIHEWAMLWLRHQLRTVRRLSHRETPELTLVDLAANLETVDEIEIEGRPTALIHHARALTAVLQLTPPNGVGPLTALPLALAPAADPAAPACAVQLVRHATPAPQAWLAVQVRREAGYTATVLRDALVNAVRRVRRQLPEQIVADPLDRAGLAVVLDSLTWLGLTATTGGDDAASPAGSAAGRETWTAWWTGRVPQLTLVIRGWPGLPGPPDEAVLQALRQENHPHTTAVAARRFRLTTAHKTHRAGEEVVALELAVRLAGTDLATLEAAAGRLTDRLTAAGAVVARLDGEQVSGLAATLPLGGFLTPYRPAVPPGPRPTPTSPRALPPSTAQPPPAVPPPPPPPPPPAPAPRPARGRAPVPAALARTSHAVPQVISVVAVANGVGASATAAALTRTLAATRDDSPALLDGAAQFLDADTIRHACHHHAFVVIDLGVHLGEAAAPALSATSRVVLVTNSGRRTVAATEQSLDRLHRVRPALAAEAVIVVGGRNSREYRRLQQELLHDHRPQAMQIVPVPYDPALGTHNGLDLAHLQPPTREAYQRLAAMLAGPHPIAPVPTGPVT